MASPRSPTSPLLPLADALGFLTAVRPIMPERVSIEDAVGAVAAQDVLAPVDVPSRPTALRDGWAVRASAVSGATPQAPVLFTQAPPRVDSGEALPPGTDAVLPLEALDPNSPREVTAEAASGEGARATGEDLRAGAVLVRAGDRVSRAVSLTLLAAGLQEISVRRPSVRLIPLAPAAGGIGTLAPALASWIAALGGRPSLGRPVPREEAALSEALVDAQSDAIFVLGGTGLGRADPSAAALARAGGLKIHGIALRPGESAGIGTSGDRPVVLIPGWPDAALAVLLALGRPLLQALAGAHDTAASSAPLRRKIASAPGWSELIFVRRTPDGLDPLGGLGLPLCALIQAEGAVLVPPDREGYPAGALVPMMQL